MKEQWKQQLQQKMADYRQPAPELSWEEVERALGTPKKRYLWPRRIAVAAVVMLTAGAGYWTFFYNNDSKSQQTAMVSDSNQPAKQQPTDALKPLAIAEEPLEKAPSTARPSLTHGAVTHLTSEEQEATQAPSQENKEEAPQPATAEKEDDNPTPTEVKEEQNSASDRHTLSSDSRKHAIFTPELRQRKSIASRLSAKVYMANAMGNNRSAGTSYNLAYDVASSHNQETTTLNPEGPHEGTVPHSDFKDDVPLDQEPSTDDKEDEHGDSAPNSDYSDTAPPNSGTAAHNPEGKHDDQHVHHRQPVRVGMSFRYWLNDRWNLESGLFYTLLASDITTTTAGSATVTKQRLNYIGVPLNVGYQLWTGHRFNLYVSAGGTIEKMLDAKPWQFSAGGAFGAEFQLTNRFSLYAEPGVSYYFPDDSDFSTFYKDRPLNFSFSLGLRFNLK